MRILVRSLSFLVFALIRVASVWAVEEEVDAPLPADQAAKSMVVPDGFHVTLFAAEPHVQQPIGFCTDDRGRLWVAEAFNYPNHGTRPGDRILILEDTNSDGQFDKRTVFYDQLNYVTGIEVGFGGVWVMSPPSFYFIPDRNRDDVPDGQPQVLLDGFGNHANSHNLANGFAWGPDGWLYGTHGRTNWSRIGKPGTPDDQRIQFDGGVYRYHPVRHVWEPYADGTTNPWGIDWDEFGEGFVCNCVNPHLFHVIQGAHYEPWRSRQSSRYAYERIATIADHLHFVGQANVRDGLGSHAEDLAGGGHAHCGTMVYLGDNWPDKYRNTVFMNNIHGKRVNNDTLKRVGSGYVASHAPDVMRSRDPWHMGVTIQYGPDGGVFVSDWSDTGECHSVRNTRRETGRIFKITYGQPRPFNGDISNLSNDNLVELHRHRNEWFVRHARRVLQERHAKGTDMQTVRSQLRVLFSDDSHVPTKLRALWTLWAIEGIDDEFLIANLSHVSEYVRGWSIKLLCEDRTPPQVAQTRFELMAQEDSSPYVRLQLASALQRLSLAQRWQIAEKLLGHAEDAHDMNLPLMNWYAIEPLVDVDLDRFVALAETSQIPLVRRHVARRVADFDRLELGLAQLTSLLVRSDNAAVHEELLTGILAGLEGRRSVPMPTTWPAAFSKLHSSPSAIVRRAAVELAVIFDDANALATLLSVAGNQAADRTERRQAISALLSKKVERFDDVLVELVAEKSVQDLAIRGLAEYNHPRTVSVLLNRYTTLDNATRQDVLQTLASRSSWASQLLDAAEKGTIARKEIGAYTIRQLLSLNDESLRQRIARMWGEMRPTPADKAQQINSLRRWLTSDVLKRANLQAGRMIFQKSCANCHRLFGDGGTIGPEITGAQRNNVDYLLENLIDPSAAVAKDFQMELFLTESGRVITGLVTDESQQAIVIQTANERIVLPKNEIERRTQSTVSMMPDGLLQNLTSDQIRDLIGYLSSPDQVALPDNVLKNP